MNYINTAFSGMEAAQQHLNATAMNLANVHTPGYSRQQAMQSSVDSTAGGKNPGSGVRIDAIRRLSDEYLVKQEWNAVSNSAYHEAKNGYLDKLEVAISNSDTSLVSGFDHFYNALSSLNTEPESIPLRQQLINSADALAMRFNNVNREIDDQKSMIDRQRTILVEKVNLLLNGIAGYNQKIDQLSSNGGNVNTLMDKRDQHIKELSQLIEVKTNTTDRGYINLTLPDGQPLVNGLIASTLKTNPTGAGLQLTFANSTFDISGSCGGQLGGINDYQNDVLQKMQDNVNTIAENFATEFNTQLENGQDITGTAGIHLFDYNSTNPKGALQITAIKPEALALAGSSQPQGDNQNVIALLKLKDKAIANLNNSSINDSCVALVSELGIASRQNKMEMSVRQDILKLSTQQREAVSGVNMNEEGKSIIQYQSVYQANMRVMNMGNKLFADLLALF
jgi:flagellar hook-associated protein 1